MLNFYATGGLEPKDTDRHEVLRIDDVDYLLTDKFKSQLRNMILDWGTFLEIYHNNITYENMFSQVTKLLNIKNTDSISDTLLPLVKKVYHLPIDAHLSCMMKQFMIYEPVSHAIYYLFTIIKLHFEQIVEKFIITRNNYILTNKIRANANDWQELQMEWNKINDERSLESSSVILLFLNPPKGIKSRIHYKIPGKEEEMNKLKRAINMFKYEGFCPKVPHERLAKLLLFPLNAFVSAIKALDSSAKFPNYNKIEHHMEGILKNKIKKPIAKDDFIRLAPPKELLSSIKIRDHTHSADREKKIADAKLLLIKWYVDKIMEMRKTLLPYGTQYEDYYIALAKTINNIANDVKDSLSGWSTM